MPNPFAEMCRRDATHVMAVVNVTPDSFSDGGRFLQTDTAVAHGLSLLEQGADVLDIGGESSAPNSVPVSAEEELARVVPVVERLAREGAVISVDTYKGVVARACLDVGAHAINDVTALRGDSDLIGVLAGSNCPVALMYSKDPNARTTREGREYGDVVADISRFLNERITWAEEHGISRNRVVIDPGMGAFVSGDPGPSLEILRRLREFETLGCPILIGASRKGFIGQVLGGLPITERMEGSLACAAAAAMNGARFVRVHDALESVRVVRMIDAIRTGGW